MFNKTIMDKKNIQTLLFLEKWLKNYDTVRDETRLNSIIVFNV